MKETTEPIRKKLRNTEELFGKYFEIKDWQGFRIILGVAAAHYLKGEMLWVRVIGASGSGKTELLRALISSPGSTTMEAITPASIRGGLIGGERLLERINRKRVIMKDLAALMVSRRDVRLEVFGLLRNVADGFLDSDFGTREGRVHQKARFDWMLATTPIAESQRQIEGMLGERFIDLRWISGDRKKMTIHALRNNPRLPRIRAELREKVRSLMTNAAETAKTDQIKLDRAERRIIAEWANTVALCRSPVHINAQTKNLESMPTPEVGTRLAQGFSRIARGLMLLGIKKWQPYVQRLAFNCIPSTRAAILVALIDKPLTAKAISENTRIPLKTVYNYLGQLELLDVIGRIGKKSSKVSVSKSGTIKVAGDIDNSGQVYRLKIELPFSSKS